MILPTKLFPPQPSSSLVNRTRLVSRLMAGIARPVTLVSAPAGFGKSTLLSEWASEAQRTGNACYGWLSLDSQDNAPAQFWAYFVAAWQSALPTDLETPENILEPVQSLLKSNEKSIADNILSALINLMLAVPVPVVIVLDDYHLIQNNEIHASLAQLIERLPAHIHLAIAARFDPPLPIARLRVREQLTEVRAIDLRFTGEEISALFQKIPGVSFTAKDIATIEASTEGWAAGLRMAVLALQSQERSPEETRQFWAAFTGRNVYVLDFLTEEVLSHLPPETQSFLIKTALLERLSDSLCAAVVYGNEKPSAAARAILDQLERANLFLIPLDQERRWFRYHHLFADLLRVRLQQQYADQTPELHRRAAAWYEQEGLIDEAMHHSIAAKDWERAAYLVEAHGNSYLDRGQLAPVLRWVEALPAEILRRRPNLCVQISWAFGHAGKTHLIGPLLLKAEAALSAWEQQKLGQLELPAIEMTEQDAIRIRASLTFFRAYAFILAAQPARALQLAEAALQTLTPLETRERAWLTWVVGYAQRGLGNIEMATRSFLQAVEISRAGRVVWEDLSTDLGIVYRLSGKLENAAQVFEEALTAGLQSGLRNKGNLSRVEAYLSAVRMEQNRVEEALEHARKAVDYLQWWPSHNHTATAHAFSGLAFLYTGSLSEAEEAIQLADQEQHKGEVTPFVTRLIETARVRLWLARENLPALKAWAEAQLAEIPDNPALNPFNEYEETRLIALTRAWIGLGRWENDKRWFKKAAQLSAALAASAEASKRVHAAIEVSLLGALACWELSKDEKTYTEEALEWLTRSLAQGLQNGYRRIYLNEGQPMKELLRVWLLKDRKWIEISGVNPEGVRQLLEIMDEKEGELPTEKPAGLVEPLTEREKDVLHLLALGLSNRAMAENLVVSEGTIKTHVHNIIGKLGAENRTQAIARAREQNLF